MYPQVDISNPSVQTYTSSTSLYPTIDANDFEDDAVNSSEPEEKVLIKVPGVIINLIEKDEKSIQLACGDLSIVSLRQGDNDVAIFARVDDQIQWPLAKDEPAVKLDGSHYFFTLRVPTEDGEIGILNYGLTIATKGQDKSVVKNLDSVLKTYSCFSVQKINKGQNGNYWEGLDKNKEVSPRELVNEPEKRKEVERSSAAYWTTLAPNVEDYSSSVARLIAQGSGQVIWGILWCGDVTSGRLKWGNNFLSKRIGEATESSDISPGTLKQIRRVKRLTKMSESVATGILSGVVKVTGFFTSPIVNSTAGKKFFSLLPGEVVLASLDGFNKVCDAVEVAGKNVMSTTSVVTTGLVSQRFGEGAGKATNEGLDAAGHAIGTAWTVFKIRKALNPKSALKPTTFAKAVAKATAESRKKK
jgi:spartin